MIASLGRGAKPAPYSEGPIYAQKPQCRCDGLAGLWALLCHFDNAMVQSAGAKPMKIAGVSPNFRGATALQCRGLVSFAMCHRLRQLLFALLAFGLLSPVVACKDTPTIPGTEIPDTEDNRDILRVLERYRTSFVRRDAAGVLSTADPSYYDAAGTDDPTDDIAYSELAPMLRERLAQLEAIRFTIDYLEISVVQDRAVVKVWIDASFQLRSIADPETGNVRVQARHTRKQDHAMFELVNDSGAWRITKGL